MYDADPGPNENNKAAKVSKGAKIRNRYNQVPHLTQDTSGKVTSSQLDAKRSALFQHSIIMIYFMKTVYNLELGTWSFVSNNVPLMHPVIIGNMSTTGSKN